MKLKKLLEVFASPEEPIDNEATVKIIQTHCKEAINSTPILRGMDDMPNVFISNPPKGRKSANTYNYVTLFIDLIHPEWQKFPKRSESWICSTTYSIASDYGTVYRVLPFGNPDIGIMNSADFWLFMNAPILVDDVARLMRYLHDIVVEEKVLFGAPPKNKSELVELLKLIDDEFTKRNKDVLKLTTNFLETVVNIEKRIEKGQTFTDILIDILSVEKNGVELKRLSELPPNLNSEVWFSERALFVNSHLYTTKIEPNLRGT